MRVESLRRYFRGYNWLMSHLQALANHPQREVIEERVKILKFFDQYGAAATQEAFGKSRATIYEWKRRLREAGGRLTALAVGSRAPQRRPRQRTSPEVVDFIREYRTLHPGVGKETILPALEEYCRRRGIGSVSLSTIGRIIKELKERREIPDARRKLSLDARSGSWVVQRRSPRRKQRRGDYRPQAPGDLVQLDTIVLFSAGVKRYLLTAVDLQTRFAFAQCYPKQSSQAARDFMEKFQQVAPFRVRRVQTDNGSEFEQHFRGYVEKEAIIHYHTYPRHPQSNGHIERFNRTVQEQHVEWHVDELRDPQIFNRGLVGWLLWYNTTRPHKSLNWQPPLRYYVDHYLKDPRQSRMSWTTTLR
jgi:putative transposase